MSNLLCFFLLFKVSYNVTVRYRTALGERIYRSTNTTVVQGADPVAIGIPLYTENSTYTIQVVAVTAGGERVVSNDTIIPEERFRMDHMGRDGKSFDHNDISNHDTSS